MGGLFGVASKTDCIMDLFYGVDYHSHLGTRRGGIVMASLPVHVVKVDGGPWRSGYSGYSPLLNSVERFYTKEGELPRIAANKGTFAEEDSWYESAGRSNADIIKLNTNREPRF